jgi:hypothetical protein
VLLFLSALCAESDPTLDLLRKDSEAAAESEAALPAAKTRIEGLFPGDPKSRPLVVQAYYASLVGLEGKYSKRIDEKAVLVIQATNLMQGLAEAAPEDIDICFLRFSLFSELPFFFGVERQVAPDLAVLIELLERRNYTFAPLVFQQAIIKRLLKSSRIDKPQYKRLSQLLIGP